MEAFTSIVGRSAKRFRNDDMRCAVLRSLWSEAAGAEVAAKSQIVTYAAGYLTVETHTKAWSTQIERLADELVKRLRRRAPGIFLRSLNVRVSRHASQLTANGSTESAAQLDPLPQTITREAAQVQDPDLRAALLKTAQAYLTKRNKSWS